MKDINAINYQFDTFNLLENFNKYFLVTSVRDDFDYFLELFNILRILKGAGEAIKVQTIKDRMIERAPNATRLMDKLCAKKLIERIPSEHDRRVVKISITSKGLDLLKSIPSNFNKDLLKNLNETEAKQLSELLEKMQEKIEKVIKSNFNIF